MKVLSLLALALILVACGGGTGDGSLAGSEARLGSAGVRLRGNLSSDGRRLNGSGSSVWRQPLRGTGDDVSYELEFRLSDGGSVLLASHADENLNNGLQVQFTRVGAGARSLQVTLQAQGDTRYALDPYGRNLFERVDASQPLRFQVDVHNGEAGRAHVLIWSPTLNGDDFTPSRALLNTDDPNRSQHGSPGRGAGTRWGLELDHAEVTRALLSAPRFRRLARPEFLR